MIPGRDDSTILKAVGQFGEIAKYHGVMPKKHAVAFDEEQVEELIRGGFLEWVNFTYGCGKEVEGLRLTPKGREALSDNAANGLQSSQPPELAEEHLLILQDIFHFSRMPRYHRMMPEKKARHYVPVDIEDLVNRGYILKIKVKSQGQKSLSGYVISSKGERVLRSSGLQ